MNALDKAREIYTDCYRRWALELSHDKNIIIARDIALYVCKHVLSDMGADRGTEFWKEVEYILKNSRHSSLYIQGDNGK